MISQLMALLQISNSEFTEMAWDGILGAVDAAKDSKHQVVETEHLMKALLEQKDGLARRIFTKAGVDNTSLLQSTDDFISQQPKVYHAKRMGLFDNTSLPFIYFFTGRFLGIQPGLLWDLTLLLCWRMHGNLKKIWMIHFCLSSI